jgi:hypothetical protein
LGIGDALALLSGRLLLHLRELFPATQREHLVRGLHLLLKDKLVQGDRHAPASLVAAKRANETAHLLSKLGPARRNVRRRQVDENVVGMVSHFFSSAGVEGGVDEEYLSEVVQFHDNSTALY